MPEVFRYKGWKYFFYSNEGDPREPLHVHVRKGGAVAKIRLEPYATVVDSYGIGPQELNELAKVADENRRLIQEKWNEFFSD